MTCEATTREVHQVNLSQVQYSISSSVFEDIYEWSWWFVFRAVFVVILSGQ